VRVFVDVDVQNAFCDPRGSMYVDGADRLIETVAALNRKAVRGDDVLVGSVDTHDFASPEFRANGGPWPAHCVKGTWDWLKPEQTLPARFRLIGREKIDIAAAFEGGGAALYFEKDAYSVFDNPNFAALLDLLKAKPGAEAPHFLVYGVATDFCVRATALDLRQRGCEVALVGDAVAAVSEEAGEAAIAEMARAGIGRLKSSKIRARQIA
jgi:nicotinamidase/pyrazinamidase